MLIRSSDQLQAILSRMLAYEDEVSQEREHLWVIGFQTLNIIKFVELVAYGSLDSVEVVPREVFRMAVAQGCSRVVVAHNHPSGSLKFSEQDHQVAKKLWESGQILDVKVIDFLVITPKAHRSMFYYKNRGPLNLPENYDPFSD